MQHSDRLPFPVEWSARIYVRAPRGGRRRAAAPDGQGAQPDPALHARPRPRPADVAGPAGRPGARGRGRADQRADPAQHPALRLVADRGVGQDEAEAVSRAQQVLEIYRPKVQVEHPEAQYRYAREFIPGEPLASTAYRRRGSVMWAAAAVPAATASVGDRRGIMLGETCTATRRPVAWDPWLAQEVRRASGLTAVVGGLGSGKSFLTGLIVYKTLRAGARWTVLDPSGPLAELTRLPELAPFSRHINLLRAEPGILNPYRVVAEPRADHFADEDEPERAWRRERSLAAATRRRLVLDVLTGLLPFDVARLPHTRIVLLRAVREVGGAPDRHPGLVIDTLRRHARDGEEHAGVRRRLPGGAPRAAAGRAAVPRHQPRRPLAGRPRLPADGADHAGHDPAAPGQPARGVDGRRVARRRAAQPGVLADPAHDLRRRPQPAQGRRAGRDPLPVPGADGQGAHRPAGPRLPQVQRPGAVRLAARGRPAAGVRLRVAGQRRVRRAHRRRARPRPRRCGCCACPTGVGYEQMLGTLSPRPRHDDRPDDTPRQFVFADGHGGVEKIRIDLEAPHLEHVREALDTNPDASRIAVSGTPGAAALRAPDEPAPLGAVADERTEAARRAVRARNGAGYVAPLPCRGRRAARRRGPRPVRRPRRPAGRGRPFGRERQRQRVTARSAARPPGGDRVPRGAVR